MYSAFPFNKEIFFKTCVNADTGFDCDEAPVTEFMGVTTGIDQVKVVPKGTPAGTKLIGASEQIVIVLSVIKGVVLTFTTIDALGPSHPKSEVWEKKYVVDPAVVVDGVGAVVVLFTPVLAVYQLVIKPERTVAVNGVAISPWQ
jgi:hypothetical protein